MSKRISWMLLAAFLVCTFVLGAEPAPGSKQAFMALPTIYITIELAQAGSKEFSAGTDAMNDSAYKLDKHLKFEIPMNMQLPGSCPSSLSMQEKMEEGRCMGWTAVPPDDPEMMDKLTSGKMDVSNNPTLVPAEYSIDDVTRQHYRDDTSKPFGTTITTYKGKGRTYGRRGGMVLCDFKGLTCDVNNISFEASEGDPVMIASTSDVPGFEPRNDKEDARLHLPQVAQESTNMLLKVPFTLSGPSTKTFTVPGKFMNNKGPDITVKVTISPKTAGKPAAAPSK